MRFILHFGPTVALVDWRETARSLHRAPSGLIKRWWCCWFHKKHHFKGKHIVWWSEVYKGMYDIENDTISDGKRWAWCNICRLQFKWEHHYSWTSMEVREEPEGYWIRVKKWTS